MQSEPPSRAAMADGVPRIGHGRSARERAHRRKLARNQYQSGLALRRSQDLPHATDLIGRREQMGRVLRNGRAAHSKCSIASARRQNACWSLHSTMVRKRARISALAPSNTGNSSALDVHLDQADGTRVLRGCQGADDVSRADDSPRGAEIVQWTGCSVATPTASPMAQPDGTI